jgi:hypothetical protein
MFRQHPTASLILTGTQGYNARHDGDDTVQTVIVAARNGVKNECQE